MTSTPCLAPLDAPPATRWWRHAVIYEVYVRSFADSDGDGVGDLAGIRSRLDYLTGLGVDALWLTPFYPSPMADGGYDVADYRDVDPTLGTLADFDALVADAHAHGLRIIADIVPNHTSSKHPWFAEACASPPGSPQRERYLFRPGRDGGETPPNDWESIFGGPAWTRLTEPDGRPGEWYLHLFDPSQPDLNWANPEVIASFDDILRFWLDRGIDGFRIDVAHGLVKADGLPDVGHTGQIQLLGSAELPYFDLDGVHDIHRRWRRILDEYPGERVAVAEAWAPSPQRLARYVRPDELHQAFNFHYLGTGWEADALRAVIDESLAAAGAVGAPTTWVLSNHDVRRHTTRFADGDAARGLRRAHAATLLMLALPGSAYLYQGEELGLPEVLDLPDEVRADPVWKRSGYTDPGRDGCRVPLPWSGSAPPFGFTAGRSWLPQPDGWADLTAQAQAADPASTLVLYRRALALREAIRTEDFEWRPAGGGRLAFARGERFVCTVNATDAAVTIPCPGSILLASSPMAEAPPAGQDILVPPDTTIWWSPAATGAR